MPDPQPNVYATYNYLCRAHDATFELMDAAESIRRSLNSRQRQCSDKAIARTTPSLLGLFTLVTLLAHHLHFQSTLKARQAAAARCRPDGPSGRVTQPVL